MNKLLTFLMLSLSFILLSCDKSSDFVVNDIIIDGEKYAKAKSDEFQITNAKIKQDALNITITYGGGCGDVEATLIDQGAVMESLPVQRNIRLVIDDNDHCEALISKTISFDLTKVQVTGEDKILFNLDGWSEALLYDY